MISQNHLKALASKYQTLELNIRREYCQNLFLAYFYQQPGTETIYFKGGTALRLIYHSPRFSEDLDFSTNLGNIRIIEQAILQTLAAVEREGIETDFQEAKPTSGGYLAIASFKIEDQIVTVQLEISLRSGDKIGEVVTVANEFVPPYPVMILGQEQLVEEKIQALLARRKPRDFYDLYFMLRSNLVAREKKRVLVEVAKLLRPVKINFEVELKQFLPQSHWATIKDFKMILAREIERATGTGYKV